MNRFKTKVFYNICLFSSPYFYLAVLLFYWWVSYLSSGYHHFDEHFQLLEFAGYKKGTALLKDMPWEYGARIRPTLQPLICYLILDISRLIGIEDPYFLAFILRAITATLAIVIIRYFIGSYTENMTVTSRNTLMLLSYLVWFMPYVNVRFSSETWSGLFFLLAMGLAIRGMKRNSLPNNILLGIVLGISILFRYQTSIMVFGLYLWFLVVRQIPFCEVVLSLLVLVITLLAGVGIDSAFYGDFQVTFYNYVNANLIQGIASQFGTSPWYEILSYVLFSTGPLGILIVIAYVYLLIYDPRNVLIWVSLPFLIIHAIIPHKELRFLFPLINLVPVVLLDAWQLLGKRLAFDKKLLVGPVLVLIILNVIAIYCSSLRGAGSAQVAIGQFIHKNYADQKVNVICVNGASPYLGWTWPKDSFYIHPNVSQTEVSSVWEPNAFHRIKGRRNLLVIRSEDITGVRTEALFAKNGLKLVYQNFSDLQNLICSIYDSSFKTDMILVYDFTY
ncbi:hypothetical protein [Pedobacter sp. SG908]|uniref:hypothetical protein n=1 Tax=Pedobacter sp. SG908 TaxID=2587135 RepID=UPI0014249630|nr:hypothetical protein [Pedobacter sp. SG908]NII83190.1 phosphatidylinositol glycan class B [Pedobacter sp. SG908]